MANSAADIHLIEIDLPEFGTPTIRPELPKELYRARLDRFAQRMDESGVPAVVVYGDREHFANLSYLTGFDPRFEEALLIVAPGSTPVLITGPENQGSGGAAPVELDVKLYPPFGLLGQDRKKTLPLADLLRQSGVAP